MNIESKRPDSAEMQAALADPLARLFGDGHSFADLAPRGEEPTVADGTTKWIVRDADRRSRAVVLCSSPVSPTLVERGMDRARSAKLALGSDLGRVVLDPLLEGRTRGLSYAVLPYCRPLSNSIFWWHLQRAALRPRVFGWLRAATKATRMRPPADEMERRFVRPLKCLVETTELTQVLRDAARTALDRWSSGAWKPLHVLAHNDLWKGNILRDSSGIPGAPEKPRLERFVVIDWPGCDLEGYAIYDLVRLADSMAWSGANLRSEVEAHCAILECDPVDARSHLAAALGSVALNLEHFPFENYRRMAERCLATLDGSRS